MERTRQSNDSQIEMLCIEAFKSSGFLIVNKTLIKCLGLLPAILLSNYIDKHIYFKNKCDENAGWFYLTHEQQIEQLNIGEHSIIKCKRLLKEIGILETKKHGIPAKEWFHINFNKLINYLQIAGRGQVPSKTGGQEPGTSGDYIRRSNNKDNISLPIKNSSKKRNEQYLPLAKYLADTILSKKNMQYTAAQILSWANDIRQIEENNKVAFERIRKGLQWYKRHIGESFVPVIESGRSLREKFAKLEAAMEREKNPIITKSIDKPPKYWDGIRYKYCPEDGLYRNVSGDVWFD